MAAVVIPEPAAGAAQARRHPVQRLRRAANEAEVVAEAVLGDVVTGTTTTALILEDLETRVCMKARNVEMKGGRESCTTQITHQDQPFPSNNVPDPGRQASRRREKTSTPFEHPAVPTAVAGAALVSRDEGPKLTDLIDHFSLSHAEVH
jgi:hypothetical protein